MARWITVRAHTERIKVIDDGGKQIEFRIPPGDEYTTLPDWVTPAIHAEVRNVDGAPMLTKGQFFILGEGQTYTIARHLLPTPAPETREHQLLLERARVDGPPVDPPPPPPAPTARDIATAQAEVKEGERLTYVARAELDVAKQAEFEALARFDTTNRPADREAAASATQARERAARLVHRAADAEAEARGNVDARARQHANFQQAKRAALRWRADVAGLLPHLLAVQTELRSLTLDAANIIVHHRDARNRAEKLADGLGVAQVAELAAAVEHATVGGALYVLQVGLDLAGKKSWTPDLRDWLTPAPTEHSDKHHAAVMAIEGDSQ